MATISQRMTILVLILLGQFFCFTNSSKDKTINDSTQPNDIKEIYEMKKKMITNSILEKTGLDKSRQTENSLKKLPTGILEKFFTETENDTLAHSTREETKKIMLRAKKVTDFDCKDCFRIHRESNAQQGSALKALVWVHLDPSVDISKKPSVKIYTVDPKTKQRTILAISRLQQRKPSGWHSIKLSDVSKYTSSKKGSLDINLILQFACNKCKLSMSGNDVPFFELSERIIVKKETTNKYSVRCTKDSKGCCLDDFHIDFNDIAGPLSQMILLPKTVNVGICRGSCNDAHAALDVHGSILRSSTMKEAASAEELCCVPKKYKPFSTLIYNEEGDIVVRNVNDLIVDGCGCA